MEALLANVLADNHLPRSIRHICIYLGIALLGAAAVADRVGGSPSIAGILILAGGAAGVAHHVIEILRHAADKRRHVEAQARQLAKRAERRKRSARLREVVLAQRERFTAVEMRKQAEKRVAIVQRQHMASAEAEMRVTQEARRVSRVLELQALNHAALTSEVAAIFNQLGWDVTSAGDEAQFDLILRSKPAGAIRVARTVPTNRVPDYADLLALNEWRVREQAVHGYLISVSGFKQRAVRALAFEPMPITLVEPHLLVQWEESSECTQ